MASSSVERLAELRAQIDDIDAQVMELLARRFEVTREVGIAKRDAGLPPVDPAREAVMFERFRSRAAERGLSPDLIEQLYRLVISAVIEEHVAIARGGRP